MSKLFKLKEWLTLDEAANHLSSVFGESVTLADIYRLALDGHLILSANFLNGAQAVTGKFIRTEEIEYRTIDKDFFTGEKLEKPFLFPTNCDTYVSKDKWISLDTKVLSIRGLWDLAMIGSEVLDIEHYYQQETTGLEVTLICLEGTFLQRGDVICQLQTDYEDNEFQQGSKAAKDKLERKIANNKFTKDEIKELRDNYKSDREVFLGGKREFERKPTYYPSGGLDDHDYIFVVKTKELTRFIQSLEETPEEAKPLTSKERNSLLVLLGAVCKNSGIEPSQRGIATSLVAMTELIGAPLTDDTIRKILNQIEPAIEARSK